MKFQQKAMTPHLLLLEEERGDNLSVLVHACLSCACTCVPAGNLGPSGGAAGLEASRRPPSKYTKHAKPQQVRARTAMLPMGFQ